MLTDDCQKKEGRVKKNQSSNFVQIPETYFSKEEGGLDSSVLAPAYYIGRLIGIDSREDFELYNLTKEIPGHPKGSTVSGKTLEAEGFRLPARTFHASQLTDLNLSHLIKSFFHDDGVGGEQGASPKTDRTAS